MIAPPSKASANGRYAQITGWGMSVPEKVLTDVQSLPGVKQAKALKF